VTAAVGLAVLALFGGLTRPAAAQGGVVSGDVVEAGETTENEATLQSPCSRTTTRATTRLSRAASTPIRP